MVESNEIRIPPIPKTAGSAGDKGDASGAAIVSSAVSNAIAASPTDQATEKSCIKWAAMRQQRQLLVRQPTRADSATKRTKATHETCVACERIRVVLLDQFFFEHRWFETVDRAEHDLLIAGAIGIVADIGNDHLTGMERLVEQLF